MKRIKILTLVLIVAFCSIYSKDGMIPSSIDKKIIFNEIIKKILSIEALKYYEKGQQELEENDYEKALTLFQKAKEIDPNNAYLVAEVGWCKEHLGDLDGAVLDYDNAIKLDITKPDLFLNKAIVQWKQNLNEEAYKTVNTALLIDSTFYDAYILKADFLFRQKKYPESFNNPNRAIQINSNLEEGYFRRGLTLVFMNNYKNAIPDLSKSISLNKYNSESYYYRACAYKMLGDTINALKDYDLGIKTKPLVKLYYDRALIYIKKNKLYKAFKDLEKAEKLEPFNLDVIKQFARLYYENRDYEEAIKYSQLAIKFNHHDIEMMNIFAQSASRSVEISAKELYKQYH
jgi:tetratricopeptide (TPR) repeat protein